MATRGKHNAIGKISWVQVEGVTVVSVDGQNVSELSLT